MNTEGDRQQFVPAWWARSALLQTLFGARPRSGVESKLQLERLELPDGDFLRLHLRPSRPDRPWILCLHGLEGCVASPYVRELEWRAAENLGWNFAAMEFRSCGGEDNRLLRSYHSGETDDLRAVLDALRGRLGGQPLCVVGYSLGGNVLLKWLGEEGVAASGVVCAAAAVSTPFDLEAAARCCDLRYGGRITQRFLATLVPKALRKAERFPGVLDPAAIGNCTTFAEFDECVTAPLHGFVSAEDYWRSCSAARFVSAIRRPTLLLNAVDDPLVPGAFLPREQVAASSHLTAEFSARGGHCGFVDGGSPWRPRRWAEARVLRFFEHEVG